MRTLVTLLALFYLANGAAMIAAPDVWYAVTPGVEHTGPANQHFIRDIGIAFAAASVAILLLLRPVARIGAGAAAAVTFLGGHAMLHVVEFFDGHLGPAEIARDTAIIVLPAAIVTVWAARARPAAN